MTLVRQLKKAVGIEESKNTFECQECGHRFESGREEADYWLSCESCGAEDVERAEQA